MMHVNIIHHDEYKMNITENNACLSGPFQNKKGKMFSIRKQRALFTYLNFSFGDLWNLVITSIVISAMFLHVKILSIYPLENIQVKVISK